MGFERTSARSGWLRVPAFTKELVVLGLVFSLSRLAHDIGLFADRVGEEAWESRIPAGPLARREVAEFQEHAPFAGSSFSRLCEQRGQGAGF